MKLWIVCCSNRVDLEPAVWPYLPPPTHPLNHPPIYISMTKHWGGPGMLAPAVFTVGARAHLDPHLDCREASSTPGWRYSTEPLLEKPGITITSSSPMDKVMAQDSCNRTSWELQDGNVNGGKKKNYQRYPKPPYSYLAMIAMVIQNSPEKKLTLAEVWHILMNQRFSCLYNCPPQKNKNKHEWILMCKTTVRG